MIKHSICTETNCRIETEYVRYFEWEDTKGAGYSFSCDENGEIQFKELNPVAKEIAEKILSGEMKGLIDRGVETREKSIKLCHCTSGEDSFVLNDARGIPVGRCCSECIDDLKDRYKPEIFSNPSYEFEDCPIEPEEY